MEKKNQIKLKDYIEGFKSMQNNLRSFYESNSEKSQVQKLLRNMREEITGLTKNQKKIKNFIETELSSLLTENILIQVKKKKLENPRKTELAPVLEDFSHREHEPEIEQQQGQGQEKDLSNEHQ